VRAMSRVDVALMAVLLLGAVAAAVVGNTAAVVLLCFMMWRLQP
jgi:hypothetical protein